MAERVAGPGQRARRWGAAGAGGRVTRKQSSAALAAARVDLDQDSVRWLRGVDGDPEALGLMIHLGAVRRDRKTSGEGEDALDNTALSAISR